MDERDSMARGPGEAQRQHRSFQPLHAQHDAPRATHAVAVKTVEKTEGNGTVTHPTPADTLQSATGADTTEAASQQAADTSLPINPPDPRDPQTLARLLRRTASGGYEISDADLVRAIRAWNARGERAVTQRLSELLVDRCMPEFSRRASGLRHRPDLMQDTIQGMIEQLLREALNPREEFMTLNFIHYLRCLCADNFGRVLRQEGLSYKRDAQGRPAGRPQHVPRALIEQIDVTAEDREDAGAQSRTIADPRDTMEERMAAVEAQRILNYLPDPLDRRILALRVFEHLRWDDIAALCGKTERTMRLRYEKARVRLRECLEAELTETSAFGSVSQE
ncbi:MAG: sigma factor-like helix-turn-helix DNA-binding protein [Ktedonobacterales bacterium]